MKKKVGCRIPNYTAITVLWHLKLVEITLRNAAFLHSLCRKQALDSYLVIHIIALLFVVPYMLSFGSTISLQMQY